MKTKQEAIKGSVQIWAMPRTEWEIKQLVEGGEAEPLPFSYQIRTQSPWTDGAVNLHEAEVTVMLPPGIDLLKKAIDTLEEAMMAKTRAHNKDMTVLKKKRDALLMIEHKPEESV